MRQRFTPGVIDYDGSMAWHYPMGRALSAPAAATWRTTIAQFLPLTNGLTILDLGSGTGRFSTFLADSFGARVIGVEPARGMRRLAMQDRHPTTVAFVAGTAEAIPLRDRSCDAAWLSQMFHHVRDRGACAGELRRVVRAAGRVLVRGTFAEGQNGFPTLLHFFPGVREIFKDLPGVDETVATFKAHDLHLDTHRRVTQQICGSLGEFAARNRLRADSSLALLSDEEFETCQTALEHAAAAESHPEPVTEILDLLVFNA
jgi:ubiquinone/menaquinone biosynthesis C-methylase UbiE